MTRILYIGNIVSGHGKTPTSVETLGKLLREEGYDVVSASEKKHKIGRLLDMLWVTLKRRKRYDIVLIDTYSTANFYYAWCVSQLCRLLGKSYIPILHGGNLEVRLREHPKKSRAIFANAKTMVAPSLFLKEVFSRYGYEKVRYIPNTILLEHYVFKHRSKLTPKLLWVRAFAHIYHPKMAVQVLHRLRERGHDASLCMVGPEKDDSSFEDTRQLADELGVAVTYTGKLSKEAWISMAAEYDIFINTTNFDNTPVSVIEAMALGLLVVSTNVGGIPYLVTHGKDGLLVKPEDPDEMAYAIERLLEDSRLSGQLAVDARKKVEGFDWQAVKEQWKALLNS